MRDKPVSHLILILFVSVLGANVIGEALRVILHFIAGEGNIVERALLHYARMDYSVGPLNLIIFSCSFEFSLHANVITLLGIFAGWYYFKYSY